MVNKAKKITSLILLFLLFAFKLYSQALVVDEAGIFTQSEIDDITEQLKTFETKAKTQASIITVTSTGDKTPEAYADDYFDYKGYGYGENDEGVLLLIVTGDGTSGSGYVHISTYGDQSISTVNDKRIEELLDTLYYEGLADRDYKSGVDAYIKALAKSFYNELSKGEALAGAGSGLLTFLLSVLGIKKGNKVKECRMRYNSSKNAIANFVPFNDTIISKNVISRTISRDSDSGNSSSGGSTTHTSSSGRTHGGGGRSF
ncbi:MAG: TPM domain-containing protein [Treponemataceae bacterium]